MPELSGTCPQSSGKIPECSDEERSGSACEHDY